MDCEVFSDVMAFDTTYKKNKCNKPLVIFSRVNHHNLIVVFACALLVDKIIETYRWVLQMLLEGMSNKKPDTVVTDGDKAMRKAIKEVLSGASHRLCAWHLQRNTKTNLKHAGFLKDLKKCLYANISCEQWEAEWEKLAAKYDAHGDKWVVKMYKR